MSIQGPETRGWFDRAFESLANGVSSGWRYWGRDETIVLARGEGGHVFDSDGKRYIDFHLGFGPVILGHGDERVASAVAAAAADGTTFAFTQEREIAAAETFKKAVPWVERLRFTNTGTEATMHALRLARGVTNRDVVVKFEGTYHGAHDYVMFSAPGQSVEGMGSPLRPIPLPMSSGMPDVITTMVRVLPFNDLEAARRLFADQGRQIAAVMVEPMLGNAMGIQPAPGFLEGLRELCDRAGSMLIFDEVKTGFRIAAGGAAEAYGVTPDIAAFAKALGNGFPVAAVGARGHAIDGWTKGGIMHAGTYCGNGVAMAAADATVSAILTGEPLARVEQVSNQLIDGIGKVLADRGVTGTALGTTGMVGIFLGDGTPGSYRDTARHNEELYEDVVMRMIDKGVMPSPDALEPWFICAAHSEDDVTAALEAFDASLGEALDA